MPSQHVYFWQGQFWNPWPRGKVRSRPVILNMHMEKSCNKKRKSHFKLIVKTIKKINTRLCLDGLCLLQLYHGVNRRVLCAIRLYWNAQLNLKVKLAKNVQKHILGLFISFYFYNLFVLFCFFFIMLSSPHPYYDLTYYFIKLSLVSLSLNFIFCTRCPASNSLASCGQYFYNIKCLLIKFVVVVVWLKLSLGLFPQLNNQMDVVQGIITRSKKRKSFLSPCHSLLDSARVNLSVNCFSSYFVIFVHAD